ncbi:MAG: hypothetical protein ABL890_00125 [Candidatus Peribacteraceae bacterium]
MKRVLVAFGSLGLYLLLAVTPPVGTTASSSAGFVEAASQSLPSRVIAFLSSQMPKPKVPSTRALYKIEDPSYEKSLSVLEWAIKRHDVRTCDTLPPHAERSALLAVCIAAVQKDESRCDVQISSTPLLHALCHNLVAA